MSLLFISPYLFPETGERLSHILNLQCVLMKYKRAKRVQDYPSWARSQEDRKMKICQFQSNGLMFTCVGTKWNENKLNLDIIYLNLHVLSKRASCTRTDVDTFKLINLVLQFFPQSNLTPSLRRKPCQHATRGCDKCWMTCIHAGVSRSPREHASVPPDKRHCRQWMSSLFCGFLPNPFIHDLFCWSSRHKFVQTDL